jgi:hypothetical protein
VSASHTVFYSVLDAATHVLPASFDPLVHVNAVDVSMTWEAPY